MSALNSLRNILKYSKITPEYKRVDIKPMTDSDNPISDFLKGLKGKTYDNKK